jgi:putative ubiquitin-RnfH superfamily antitoxin RatB of RatAB toxin-antitoxin module
MEIPEQGMDVGIIDVEVVYALPQRQVLRQLSVSPHTTVEQAVELSGLKSLFPEIDSSINKLGIFGKLVKPSTVLRNLDRVEIYRPLITDPKESRRQRAAKCREMRKG